MKKGLILLFATAILFTGCKKDNQDPQPPVIEFGGWNYKEKDANGNDVVVELIIKFKDVNGDIGTKDDEKEYIESLNCDYQKDDLSLYYEENKNGVYVINYIPIPQPDTLFDINCNTVAVRYDSIAPEDFYAAPFIEPEGNNKSVEGEINCRIEIVSLAGNARPIGRFRVFLKDRAGNKSNEIYTEDLILKY